MGEGGESHQVRRHSLRQRLTASDCSHGEEVGVRCTAATGIQLQRVVLTPTPWDTSKHQSVRGNGSWSICTSAVLLYV